MEVLVTVWLLESVLLQVYRVCGMTVLCYPLIFEVSEFYLYRDMALLIDDIKTELHFVGRYWRLSGRPTVCLLIREEHMRYFLGCMPIYVLWCHYSSIIYLVLQFNFNFLKNCTSMDPLFTNMWLLCKIKRKNTKLFICKFCLYKYEIFLRCLCDVLFLLSMLCIFWVPFIRFCSYMYHYTKC